MYLFIVTMHLSAEIPYHLCTLSTFSIRSFNVVIMIFLNNVFMFNQFLIADSIQFQNVCLVFLYGCQFHVEIPYIIHFTSSHFLAHTTFVS